MDSKHWFTQGEVADSTRDAAKPPAASSIAPPVGFSRIASEYDEHLRNILHRQLLVNRSLSNDRTLNSYICISGKTGSGKLTLANYLMTQYFQLGLIKAKKILRLRYPFPFAATWADTLARINAVLKEAEGGMLYIENVPDYLQAVNAQQKDQGRMLLEYLATYTRRKDEKVVVLFGGETNATKQLLTNELLVNLPPFAHFYLRDYSAEELTAIVSRVANADGVKLSAKSGTWIQDFFKKLEDSDLKGKLNGHVARNLAERLAGRLAARIMSAATPSTLSDLEISTVTADDARFATDAIGASFSPSADQIQIDESALASCMAELEKLVGMDNFKNFVRQLIRSVRSAIAAGKPLRQELLVPHMVFVGSPGTGKTVAARQVGKLLHALGVLKKGHTVDVTASN